MAFINNPLIASLAGAVGLGHLVPGADPAVGVNPTAGAPHSAPNVPTFKDRPYTPRPMNIPGQREGSGGSGQMATEPGAMSPDVQNNPTVSDLLNHFGVHPQQEVDPHLFIHNAQAWANHPVMSGVLEGLLSGAANTKGSDTIGEGISNVAQGIAATHDQQVQHVNAQLQMPYNQAMTVANLQDQVSKQSLQKSQQLHDNAMSDFIAQRPQMEQALADTKAKAALDVQTERGKNMVAREAERGKASALAASLKPANATNAAYQASLNGHLAEITKGRDLTDEEQKPTAFEMMQAAHMAVADTMIAPKVATATQISHNTVDDKKAVKAVSSGAPRATPYDLKTAADADAAYKKAQGAASFLDTKSGKVIMKGSPEMEAYNKPLKDARDAAYAKLPGAPVAAAPAAAPTYSPNNPFKPKP